jgi:hypothetical protein
MKSDRLLPPTNAKVDTGTMVKTIAIECPHCKETFEVLLSNNASMIILNCPLCSVPLIYYKTRCFVLNRHQIDRIRKSRQDTTVLKILHSISKEQHETRCAQHAGGGLNLPAHSDNFCTVPATFMPCTRYITRDDVLNLRIELETCADSKQFIDRM